MSKEQIRLRDIVGGSEYVYIEYHSWIPMENFSIEYMLSSDAEVNIENQVDTFVGNCVYENGYLKGLDNNRKYRLTDECDSYEWTDEENLTVWVQEEQ